MMPDCHQSSQLMSEALDRQLSAEERVSLERHLKICLACQNCERQFAWIREAFAMLRDGGPDRKLA